MEGEDRYEQQRRLNLNLNAQGEANIKSLLNQKSPKCPRCDSVETKFCYFNNYKTSQPRYVCKTCKRFWTQGGTIRNVPLGGERRVKRARDSSSSGGGGGLRITAVSSLQPPFTVASAGGNVRRGGTLNFTRPQPHANHPQIRFVRVDISNLSFTKGLSNVPNPSMASPEAQGQSHPVQPNSLFYQAYSGQGLAAHPKPNNHVGPALWNPSRFNTTAASHYLQPHNANIFWNNSNQIGGTSGSLSGSSSIDWSAHLPGYDAEA